MAMEYLSRGGLRGAPKASLSMEHVQATPNPNPSPDPNPNPKPNRTGGMGPHYRHGGDEVH